MSFANYIMEKSNLKNGKIVIAIGKTKTIIKIFLQDSRIIQTKRAIKAEIINLLRQYPLNKITVKMLCDKAEINRATFYRYYEDVYDLYDKIKAQFIDEIFAVFQDANLLQTQDNIKTFLAEVIAVLDSTHAIAFTLHHGAGRNITVAGVGCTCANVNSTAQTLEVRLLGNLVGVCGGLTGKSGAHHRGGHHRNKALFHI